MSNCIILDKNKENIDNVSELVTEFLRIGYSFYKTNYSLIDSNLGGLESSSVSIISGPSNHAKSLFMLNLIASIAKCNDFKDNDTFVVVTLEDDIYKLLRRVISIFGSYYSPAVKQLFVDTSSHLKSLKNIDINSQTENSNDNPLVNRIKILISKILQDAIRDITQKNVGVSLVHSNENTFTTSDLAKRIDKLILQGLNVKLAAIDYIDVMSPNTGMSAIGDDYNAQGQILQEMRVLSRLYHIPVLTITQNVRSSENPQHALSNSMMGDSYKKVRYSDYIYMVRMRHDMDILSERVREDTDDVNTDYQTNTTNVFQTLEDKYLQELCPFEVKITKAKDGKKDKVKFHLFSGHNLRIYDNLSQFYADLPRIKETQKFIQNELNLILSESSIDFGDTVDVDYDLI